MEQTVNRYEIVIEKRARSISQCVRCGQPMKIRSTTPKPDGQTERYMQCASYPACEETYTHTQYDDPIEL